MIDLELAKEHLSDDGIFVQWVPIYEMSINDFKSFYKTFNSIFPNVVAFANLKTNEDFPVELQTTQIILLGSDKEFINDENLKLSFDNLFPDKKEYLEAIWLNNSDDLLNLVLFTDDQMRGYADSAELITDDNAKLEFSTAKNIISGNPEVVLKDIEDYINNQSE